MMTKNGSSKNKNEKILKKSLIHKKCNIGVTMKYRCSYNRDTPGKV